MCTVTYIPGKFGFHLTSNRDEHISRGQASPPVVCADGQLELLHPVDADKRGSWIAAKSNGDLAVLLNGAFVKHLRQSYYRRSRGIILMEIICSASPLAFFKQLDLTAIEPFTLILFSSGKLIECRWDGQIKYITRLDKKKQHIWSSATLYDEAAVTKRKRWFKEWGQRIGPKTTSEILRFHWHAGSWDLKDGLVMDRDGIMKTRSITNIRVTTENITMTYHDLKDGRRYVREMDLDAAKNKANHQLLPRFYNARRFFIRLTNWEFWSFNTLYTPIILYWFWLSFKSRSFLFFNTAKPLIENGGFAMESKWNIYPLIPERVHPKTLLFKPLASLMAVKDALLSNGFTYPVIAKPDIGARGILVKKIHNEAELEEYIRRMRVDYLVQAYVRYPNEAGIFYHRMPGEDKGTISGIVGKEFLTVTGDGRSNVIELLSRNPRYFLQIPDLLAAYGQGLKRVIAKGNQEILVPYGNHARGAKFIDLSHLITKELTESIDRVCREIPEFYFGRMDIMYDNWQALCKGEQFSIVELNGSGSEPTHIYDPKHSVFFAWHEIMRHWKLLNKISRMNHQQKNLRYMTFNEGIAMLKANTNYLKLIS
jgi:hypothetical protein